MFNIGPLELLVLAGVALIVVGPDRLPGFAREAANMIRTLRELASGARQQLTDELGPEFEELAKLRNLNPRTAVQRAVFGDDVDLNSRSALRDAIFGDEDVRAADPRRVVEGYRADLRSGDALDDIEPTGLGVDEVAAQPVSMSKPASGPKPVSRRDPSRPRPRPRPPSTYDEIT